MHIGDEVSERMALLRDRDAEMARFLDARSSEAEHARREMSILTDRFLGVMAAYGNPGMTLQKLRVRRGILSRKVVLEGWLLAAYPVLVKEGARVVPAVVRVLLTPQRRMFWATQKTLTADYKTSVEHRPEHFFDLADTSGDVRFRLDAFATSIARVCLDSGITWR